MMEKQFTKGKCIFREFNNPKVGYRFIIASDNGDRICTINRDDNDDNAAELSNAELITDAFNTANKTGLFPSEILEQRDELLNVCKIILDLENDDSKMQILKCHAAAVKAIKKVTNGPAH